MNNKEENEKNLLYFLLNDELKTDKSFILLSDICEFFCQDENILKRLKNLPVCSFHDNNTETQKVLSSTTITGIISSADTSLIIIPLGADSILISRNVPESNCATIIKTVFLCMIAFFGSLFSIMSYNGDTGMPSLLQNIHTLCLGNEPVGISPGACFYSVGLAIGIMVFFNHDFFGKFSKAATPIEVDVALYENDVNTVTIKNSKQN